MSNAGVRRVFSKDLLDSFVEVLIREVGVEKLPMVLARCDLSPGMIARGSMEALDGAGAADLYARLQQALRLFYGRGARGILMRIGYGMWEGVTARTSLLTRAELRVIRSLPFPARPRRALEAVVGRLREGGGLASVRRIDLDLLLVDHSSAATLGQVGDEPICLVTLGMIQGALVWATGQEADVEEISCRAMGASACEFKIKSGGPSIYENH
ncbi:MAG: 4-vinyl reductase [Anaerolineales bacterium]|nr:4-vinyl reductase [Anaerolineales bacterium]